MVDGENVYYISDDEKRRLQDRDLGYVYVLSGSRGSGKTLTMSFLALEYLIKRHRVWSNYKVEFPFRWINGSVKWYQTSPVTMNEIYRFDQGLSRGIICIDEVNLWCSRKRSMTTANRLLNNTLQLLRKRQLTFLFTPQSYNWLDSVLQFQVDCHMLCNDQYYLYPNRYKRGTMIKVTFRDMSGVFTGKVYDQKYFLKEYIQYFGVSRIGVSIIRWRNTMLSPLPPG